MAAQYSSELQSLIQETMAQGRDGVAWTQGRLAATAGLSPTYLRMIVKEGSVPSPDVLQRIAEALGLDVNQVMAAARPTGLSSAPAVPPEPFSVGPVGHLPLHGPTPCGPPDGYSHQDEEATLVEQTGATLGLTIIGDSMPPFESGDGLFVCEATTPYWPGRSYIVEIDGGVLCKRLDQVTAREVGDEYTLISTRDGSPPLVVSSENARLLFEVLGRYVPE